MVKHILIATDGSTLSDQAIDYGITLAQALHARVSVITVTTPWPLFPMGDGFQDVGRYAAEMDRLADEILSRADDRLATGGVAHDTIKINGEQAYKAIIDAATNHGCDLILMASHGRRGLSAIVLGSETLKVLTHSKIPVLVFRAKS